jgi:hypothetical protein
MALRNTGSTSNSNGERTDIPRPQNIKLIQETITKTVRTFHAVNANNITSGGENNESK